VTDPELPPVPPAVFIEPLDDEEAGAFAALAAQESGNYERALAGLRPITEPDSEE